jgi:hypothetical protein
MPTYKFSCQITVSGYTTVEAPDEAAALEIAQEREVQVAGLGIGVTEEECWLVDEIDGEPENIQLSPATGEDGET